MIKKVILKNFQSHEDTTLEFCPTTNSIVGRSNNGKTVVLRALAWVITNRPLGDAFVSHWARDDKGNQIEDTSVTIETDTHIVTRLKTSKGNYYIVDGVTLEAVGTSVPDAVTQALNMTEVNVQKQMDAPFLLSETPGEVARFFNKIVHLDKIDVYLSAVESKKRKTKGELEQAKENKEKTEMELKSFAWTDRAEVLLHELETVSDSTQKLETDIAKIRRDIPDLRSLQQRLEATMSILDKAPSLIEEIKTCTAKVPLLEQRKQALAGSIQDFRTRTVSLASAIDTAYAVRLVEKIQRIQDGAKTIVEKKMALQPLITQYKGISLVELDRQIKEAKDSLPLSCPMCGGPIHA